MYEKITLDYAVSVFSRGKKGIIGIIRLDDGSIICQGLGCNNRVIDLCVAVNGKVYDATNYEHRIIVRKKIEEKSEWAVIFSEDETYCETSSDPVFDFCCIAFVKPTQQQKDTALYGDENLPVVVKIKFKGEKGAVTVSHAAEFLKLALIEKEEMAEKAKNAFASPLKVGGDIYNEPGTYQERSLVTVGND